MEKPRSSKVQPPREPLSDATGRINNAAPSKGRDNKSIGPGHDSMILKSKEESRGASKAVPTVSVARQPENALAPDFEMVHDSRHLAVTNPDPDETNDARRVSQFSNISSTASSIRARKTHIGPWQLGKTLGKGSSARVRAARHRVTHQFAAVKIVAKNTAHITQAGSLAKLDKIDRIEGDSPDGVRRMPLAIEREVAILKLIQHPNIVRLYDIWENRSEIYLVLEYVEKGDLFEFINWQGRLREEEAIFYFRQMMSAIQYCHSLNICHRDLKPENILLTSDGQVKIADFGMAALHQSPTHQLRTACGSPHYAAPELLKQRMYKGESADIWSMGVILFAMLAGRLPFDEPEIHVMLAKAKMGDYEMPSYLSADAKDLIHRILQVEPHRRISMAQMWKHPLIRKYDYLDDLNANGGQPPDIRRDAQLKPLDEEDIDPQILRQLRSVWHAFSEEQLKEKLLSNKPNDEKLFYRLLYNYREAQLENFNPQLPYSKSDFHHLRPPNLGKRISTCQFTQPSRKGHARNVSRFTVISNVAETESGTIQSYDPYNASRILQPCQSQVSHAKIIVHRNSPEPSTVAESGVVSHSYRSYKSLGGTLRRKPKMDSQRSGKAAHLKSPRSSMSSIQSSRTGVSHVRPNTRRKRGVDFSAVRKQPGEARRPDNERSRKAPASIAGDNTTYGRDVKSPSSPIKKTKTPSPTSAQTMAVVAKSPDESIVWTEELKQLGHKIAEHCDEAFRSSLLTSPSEGNRACAREASPLSFSLESPPVQNQTSGVQPPIEPPARTSSRPWDSRPLPPIPIEEEPTTPEPQTAKIISIADSKTFRGQAITKILSKNPRHTTRPAVAPLIPERRTVSAPVYSQYATRDMNALPLINEGTAESSSKSGPNQGRIVSAPADATGPLPSPNKAYGLDYLARIENTIRVVHSPQDQKSSKAVEIPEPLSLGRKSSRDVYDTQRSQGTRSRMSLRDQAAQGGSQNSISAAVCAASRATSCATSQDNGTGDEENIKKSSVGAPKKMSWFRRQVKDHEGSSLPPGTTIHAKEPTSANHNYQSDSVCVDETSTDQKPKKKGFILPFWKTGRNDVKFSSDREQFELASPDFEASLNSKHRRPAASPAQGTGMYTWFDNDSGGRKIEVHQNWLARLFRVKPATRYLCLTMSRRRARQEIAILLREWRKYGIKDVEVDKRRNLVFARVGPKNYLNMKEVSFAAEIMTVIEHGKRNHLSIVRFTQERGAASSFHKVVDTMHSVLCSRNLAVADKRKAKMMIKTLNS
ncbi:hypothetical protein VTK73DRAFT_8970 [Phialemonium thermophilum]|uniref:non-specific serine/threonine protein kinase n=1 Tax=Phialemonium thermophilum TaxID=223376 RepID=A0ABR3Y525_9PEZI